MSDDTKIPVPRVAEIDASQRPKIKPPPSAGHWDHERKMEQHAMLLAENRARRQAPLIAEHRWLDGIRPEFTFEGDADDEQVMVNYREPNWSRWLDDPTWDVLRDLPPLLLEHEPDDARRAPYLTVEWCHANMDRRETNVVRRVSNAAWAMELGKISRDNVIRATPFECIKWAEGKGSVSVPPPLRDWWHNTHGPATPAALPSTDGQATRPTWADVPLPCISDTKPEIRRAFVIYVSQRCAGLLVPPNKAGSVQLVREYESTIASYTRDEAQFPKWYEPLRDFAGKHPGGWGLVFEALGRMHPLAD